MEGSESIRVPKDFADMGGDIGPEKEGDKAGMGDTGGRGDLGSLGRGEGGRPPEKRWVWPGRGDGGRPEKRCGCVTRLSGESSAGSFGMPWLDRGEYSVREPERLWAFVLGSDVDMVSERADSAGDRLGSMAVCCASLG